MNSRLPGTLVLILALACGGSGIDPVTPGPPPPPPPPPAPVASVTVAPDAPSVMAGATVQLAATMKDALGNTLAGRAVTWSSAADAVATVSASGLVTAVTPGSTQIRATSEGVTGQANITVSSVAVASVTLSQTAVSLVANQPLTLTATAKDAQGNVLAGRTIAWTSSAPTVASVSQAGVVTATTPGTATITATSESKTAQAVITVADGGFITATGGMVTGAAGNVTLNVPAGALVSATALTVSAIASPPANPKLIAGTAYDFGPNGTTFATPITMNITYDAANVGAATPANFRLHRFTGGVWTPIAGSTVNTTTKIVTGQTSSFSQYAIVEVAAVGPAITALVPSNAVATGAGFLLAVNGSGFNSDAVVRWNGVARTTTFVSATQVLAVITAADLAAQGSAQVTVFNTGTGGVSTAQSFTISGGALAISVSRDNTCGLKSDGKAYCWAFGADSPLPVPGSFVFHQISTTVALNETSCALIASGAAYCWTGIGTPAPVPGGRFFTTMEIGADLRCGLDNAGIAYCWGSNSDGFSSANPVTLGGPTFASLTVGGFIHDAHACGLTADGTAYCWGLNFHGELGDGTSGSGANRAAPTAVAGGLKFISIDAGAGQTCGVTLNGAAYCWGSGNLGTGGTSSSPIPAAVAGGHVFRSVSLNEAHACGITISEAVWCWGDGRNGVLGQGIANNSSIPVAVSGGLSFRSVSPGITSTCGITTGGDAYCWGAKRKLGIGNSGKQLTPVAVAGGVTFTDISVSANQSCAVATGGGAVYCWGANRSGGDPSGIDDPTPHLLPGGVTLASLAPGGFCGLSTAGAAWCWGPEYLAGIGSGYRTSPVQVGAGSSYQSLAFGLGTLCGVTLGGDVHCAGQGWSGAPTNTTLAPVAGATGYKLIGGMGGGGDRCALKTNGAAFCAGANFSGQQGNGGGPSNTTLSAVNGGQTFTTLATGYAGTCGLNTSGAAYCWGSLDGTSIQTFSPTILAGGLTYTGISRDLYFVCAVATGNVPYCLGDASNGALGTSLTSSSDNMRAVMGPQMTKVSVLGDHACGLTTAGAAYCWGGRGTGVIGDGILGYIATPTAVIW